MQDFIRKRIDQRLILEESLIDVAYKYINENHGSKEVSDFGKDQSREILKTIADLDPDFSDSVDGEFQDIMSLTIKLCNTNDTDVIYDLQKSIYKKIMHCYNSLLTESFDTAYGRWMADIKDHRTDGHNDLGE